MEDLEDAPDSELPRKKSSTRLIEAVRYGEQPEVRARLTKVVENAFDKSALQTLLEERALAHDAVDASRVYHIC